MNLVGIVFHPKSLARLPGEAGGFFRGDASPGQAEGEENKGGLIAHLGIGLFRETEAGVTKSTENGSENEERGDDNRRRVMNATGSELTGDVDGAVFVDLVNDEAQGIFPKDDGDDDKV